MVAIEQTQNVAQSTVAIRDISLRDLVALTKPNITWMSVIVAAGGYALSTNGTFSFVHASLALLATALSVMGSGALNMYLERNIDGFMSRTKDRPLPSGRTNPFWALLVGSLFAAASLPIFWVMQATVAFWLTAASIVLYVFVYTPMKQKSPWALFVGAIPGAMPAVMGYTAREGQIDAVAITLFAIVFFWQLPHFLAIGIYRDKEYKNAGHKLFNHVMSEEGVKSMMLGTAVPLVAASLFLYTLGTASIVYAFLAATLGIWFLALCVKGFAAENINKWARRVFFGTLVHQTVLFGVLAADVGLRRLFF